MPFKSYTEAWCDVCGLQIWSGACQTLDGTPENDGLTFCCLECQEIHREDVRSLKKWHGVIHQDSVDPTPNREPYRQYCFSCENFRNLEPDSPRRGNTANHICVASGDILGVRTWNGYDEEQFENCRRTFANCFEHRKQIFVEPEEIDRFQLMDFEE